MTSLTVFGKAAGGHAVHDHVAHAEHACQRLVAALRIDDAGEPVDVLLGVEVVPGLYELLLRRVDVHAGGGAVPVGGEAEDAAELAHGPKLLAVDDQQSALEVEVAAVDLDVLPALGEVELYAVKRALRVREAGDVGELGPGSCAPCPSMMRQSVLYAPFM